MWLIVALSDGGSGKVLTNGIFITGTDTDVGKSVVAAVLARILHQQGKNIGVMKPVTSGCRRENGRLISEDAELLAWSAGFAEVSAEMAPYLLELPIAPAEAARRQGVKIDFDVIAASLGKLAAKHDFIIVEGAGGLMAPIADGFVVADLAKRLSLPLLIVARSSLGTVNHTLLTCLAARSMDIPVRGIIVNGYPEKPGPAEESAPRLIAAHTDIPILGLLPWCDEDNCRQLVARLAGHLMDKPDIFEMLHAIGAINRTPAERD